MRLTVHASVLTLIAAPAALAAQSEGRGQHPTVAVTLGPAVIVETWTYTHLALPDTWYEGASLGLRLTTPLSEIVAVGVHGMAFQAPGGRSLQTATAGIEVRVGSHLQVPFAVAVGAVRQPSALVCVDFCPPDTPKFGHRVRLTVEASIAYEWRVGRSVALGPEFTVSRALTDGQRYYGMHLGLRLTKDL